MLRKLTLISLLSLAAFVGQARAQTIVFTPNTTTISSSGGTITFTATITYTTTPSVLAFSTTLPTGWSYLSGSNLPPVAPTAGTVGKLDFSYITTPPSPVSFTFNASYPAGLTGLQPLTTQAITRDTTGSPAVTTTGPTVNIQAPPVAGLWNGGTGNWTDSTQWSGGIIPNNSGLSTYSAQLSAGTVTIPSGSAISINDLLLSGATLNGLGTLTILGSGSNWTSGTIPSLSNLIIASGATFTASTFGNHDFNGTTITNQGQFNWVNGGPLRSAGGGSFVNAAGATFTDASSGITTYVISNSGAGGTFTFSNAGNFVKTASSATSVQVPFTNTGNILINAGSIAFTSTYTQTAGLFKLASGTTASFTGGLTLGGGSLIGNGTVTNNVSNSGTISPGDTVGTLNIQGNLTLLSTSQLLIDLAGTTQGSTYDLLNVTGTATLGGTLSINLVSPYSVTTPFTTQFTVLNSTSLSGTFTNAANGARITTLHGDGSFLVNYTGTSVILSGFVAIPEPSTWALLATGLGAVAFGAFRRRRAQK